jgi:hypothetical protein
LRIVAKSSSCGSKGIDMKELSALEINQVSGGLAPDDGALAIIALGLCGGPFTMGFGLAIGIGILLR